MKHKAKKSLGQNFLKSAAALKKIVEAGEIKSGDVILEIGPGKGALTEKLLERVERGLPSLRGKVIAVEKDHELVEFLEKKFEEEIKNKKLILVNDDILNFSITNDGFPIPKNYKLIANIPYNITGAVLKKFLSARNQPELMVLMLQHEVAKRIMARDKKESLLSISVKAYGTPKIIMKVPARYFSPAPKVDSVIISIKNISRQFFEQNNINEENFWQIVKAGFAHKRKKLGGNLKNIANPIGLASVANKRAEDLALADWIELTRA